MAAQNLKPAHIEVVNDPPESEHPDITKRYRLGYDRLRGKGFDIIALIEDDDYYRPEYLQTMVSEWERHGRPELFGTNYTIYYHIGLFAHFEMRHISRSSAMSTLIKPDLNFDWCPDYEVYTDIHLWMNTPLKGTTFKPDHHICLGIKHGVGMTGGFCHKSKFHRFVHQDQDKTFLKSVCDPESFDFYTNYLKKVD